MFMFGKIIKSKLVPSNNFEIKNTAEGVNSRLVEEQRSFNIETTVLVLSRTLQILIGFALIGITALGLLKPIWLSSIISLEASISAITGVYLIFYFIISQGTFDSLVKKAINRAIKEQN